MVKLAVLRRRLGWSQADLATKIGVTRAAVSRWEIDGEYGLVPREPTKRLLGALFAVPWEGIEFGATPAPTPPTEDDR